MKKLLLLLTLLLTLGATSAWADTYSWVTSSGKSVFTNNQATLNGATWIFATDAESPYLGVVWSSKNDTWKGQQFGKKDAGVVPFSISTDYFKDKTITSVKIVAAGATSVSIDVKVGGAEFGVKTALTDTSNAEYNFTGNASGTLSINYSGTTTAAVYWRSIEVTYTDNGSETPVDPVPVVLGDIVVTYNGVAVEGETVEVEKGKSLNISAENAESISIYDVNDALIKTINGSVGEWTPEADDIVKIEATLDGVDPKTRLIDVTVKESETPVDPTPDVPADAIDVITVSSLGLDTENNPQTYKDYTKTIGNSEYMAYANIANGSNNEAFGIRPTTTKSGKTTQGGGIVVTKSSGFVSRVIATQWSEQSASKERKVTVYGQHTPYTTSQATSDSDWGTELGTITLSKGVAVALVIKEKYEYIAIMPVSDASMLSEIKIEWVKNEETPELPEGAFAYTVDGIGEDGDVTLVDGKAEITFSGVHKEVKIYFKHEAAAAAEPVVRKALDHNGFEVAAYDEAADTHKITLTQPGTLTYYAAHDASGNAEDPKTITVKASEPTTGIGSIAADDAEGNVEYFNLQGVKVNIDNAAPGLYIRRQGNTVSKVIK